MLRNGYVSVVRGVLKCSARVFFLCCQNCIVSQGCLDAPQWLRVGCAGRLEMFRSDLFRSDLTARARPILARASVCCCSCDQPSPSCLRNNIRNHIIHTLMRLMPSTEQAPDTRMSQAATLALLSPPQRQLGSLPRRAVVPPACTLHQHTLGMFTDPETDTITTKTPEFLANHRPTKKEDSFRFSGESSRKYQPILFEVAEYQP